MSKDNSAMSEKNDVFVGNLPFTATQEKLLEIFSLVGQVKTIRIINDSETGRSKGFAFVEYYDAAVAIAAIKHLNNTEFEGKQLRIGFAANSKLREKARELGEDIADTTSGTVGTGIQGSQLQWQSSVAALNLSDAWDILDSIKKLAETNKKGAKQVLEAYPQLVFALYEIQKRLGVVSNSAVNNQNTNAVNVNINANPNSNSSNINYPTIYEPQIQQQTYLPNDNIYYNNTNISIPPQQEQISMNSYYEVPQLPTDANYYMHNDMNHQMWIPK